jgi:predicted PurR-regulated permease PerM
MISSKDIAKGIVRAVVILSLILLGLLFIYKIQTLITYIIVATVITVIVNPMKMFLMQKLKLKNVTATVLTMILFLSLFLGFSLLFVPLIITQANNLSLLNTQDLEEQLLIIKSNLAFYLNAHNIDFNAYVNEYKLLSKFNFDTITSFVNSIINAVAGFGVGLISVLFILFFFLKDQLLIFEKIKKILPTNSKIKYLNSIQKTNQMLSRYFVGLLIQLTVVFLLNFIVLLIFSAKNAFIIAFLCAFLNIIPYVGPLSGILLAGLLSFSNNIGKDFTTEMLPQALSIMIGFFIVQLIDANISQPIIFSKSVKSHPLEIFLIILAAGSVWGIIGMVVAIPLYTICKVVAKEFFPENKIVSVLTEKI